MTDRHNDDDIESISEDVGADSDSQPVDRDDNVRSDIEQAVEARSDALERGEGGSEHERLSGPGMPDGVGGTGATKNQNDDAQ